MRYTKDDIIDLYRNAKDKKREVRILVDLTCTDVDTILAILEDAGEFDGKYKVCTKCGKQYPAISNRKSFCPDCKKREYKISQMKYELKQVTAEIQQLGLKSARIRREIERLENEK